MKMLIVERTKIIENIQKIKSMTNSTIIATLKNNGYGLGLYEFPKLLAENGIDYFAVSTLEEALTLRNNGIDNKIMILHSIALKEDLLKLLANKILPTVGSFSALSVLNEIAAETGEQVEFQIKIDTGFGRFGFLPHEIPELIEKLKSMPNLLVVGTFSHFSSAFSKSSAYTDKQFDIFNKCVGALRDAEIDPGVCHICNSSAALLYLHMHLDAIRVGSAFLGRLLVPNTLELSKIGYMLSEIEDIKILPPKHYIGYSNTYKTDKETTVGIVPVGYLDGFTLQKGQDCFDILGTLREIYGKIKNFNKKHFVTIGSTKVPVLGKVGTNNIIIDITGLNVKVGDFVKIDVNPMLVPENIHREFII